MKLRLVLLCSLSIAFVGCDDDDDEDGGDGNGNGNGAETCLEQATGATPSQTDSSEILGACAEEDGLSVVFSARNAGQPIEGLTVEGLRFTAARLVEDDRPGPVWQSYINRTEEVGTPAEGADPWPGTEPAVQATAENNGTLESRGNGIYVYRYATDIRAATDPVAVPFDENAVHRVGYEYRTEGGPLDNPVYTWIPAGGDVQNARAIAATESCNDCHDRLAVHGGARTEVPYCVTCHNPGSTDAQSGNTVDMPVMIHKIHRGSELPSVEAEGRYVIWGFQNAPHDYSQVVFPQSVANCRSCHNAAVEGTPQGDNWKTQPSMQACGACHDDIAFTEPVPEGMRLHSGGAVDNNDACAGCHTADAIEGHHAGLYETENRPTLHEGVPKLSYELSNLTVEGNQPVVTFRITADGAPLDITTDTLASGLSFTHPTDTAARVRGPRLLVAWRRPEGTVTDPADDNTYRTAAEATEGNAATRLGQPQTINVRDIRAQLTANGDGTYTTAAGALGTLPEGQTHVTVGLEGLFYLALGTGAEQEVEELGADSVTIGTTDPPRREIVDIANCNVCHERLMAHGDNRQNNIQICVMCHNPSATDRGRRPADASTAPDQLVEQSIDFREMIHKLHRGEGLEAEQYIIYGFLTPTSGRPIDFGHVVYPGNIANCTKCHNEGTYRVPIEAAALATTKLTGDDQASPDDDQNIWPTSAACTGCHDSAAALQHAQAAPENYSNARKGTEGETCQQCHGAGGVADVDVVHPVGG